MQNNYAIILAGGLGTRTGKYLAKQFLDLDGKPVIIHTLERFNLPQINGIIVVMAGNYIDYTNKLIKDFSIEKIIKIIEGGKTRQGSSYNAVKCLDYNNDDILIFHDAARPFIDKKIIVNCIKETERHGASGVYVRATDTIAEIENSFVKAIPGRENLYYTQTPQTFRYSIIKEAHELALSKGIDNRTDDVQLVVDAGYKVKIVEGKYRNIKITTSYDLDLAGFIAKGKK